MKAAVLHEVNKPLVIEDVSLQKPGPREVLIRTSVAGSAIRAFGPAIGEALFTAVAASISLCWLDSDPNQSICPT